ncbi:MAG: non-homologous end-joining DNA ligase [Myxococcota bacterium]
MKVPRHAERLIPHDQDEVRLDLGGREVRLTNLRKVFWPESGYTKGDLLRYYAKIAPVLLPHLRDRAMVMRRYPNGITGKHFFMKHAPAETPEWVELCSIEHGSGNIVDFPVVQDFATLMWIVNLGCIDLNEWYARCKDVDRPDYLHFDLDPVPGADFETVRRAALRVHEGLDALGIRNYAKTTGSKGVHVYVPIERGPNQKRVWGFAKAFARAMARREPQLLTAEYRVSKRPRGRVLVDYNQNAWGRTLASVYSVRPRPLATVSTPVTWEELEGGVRLEDFRMDNVPQRIEEVGDLWAPMNRPRGRVELEEFL